MKRDNYNERHPYESDDNAIKSSKARRRLYQQCNGCLALLIILAVFFSFAVCAVYIEWRISGKALQLVNNTAISADKPINEDKITTAELIGSRQDNGVSIQFSSNIGYIKL